MLSLTDVPENLEKLHHHSKELSISICDKVSALGNRYRLQADTDLFQTKFPAYVLINDGIFKYFNAEKMVRFYSENDLAFVSNDEKLSGSKLISEFGSEVTLFKAEELEKALCSDQSLMNQWFMLQNYKNQIMHMLCSQFINEDLRPNIKMQQFKEGEIIIEENSAPNEIFEMINGSAIAFVKGVQVGEIRRKEVFGEISFLTGKKRTATVKAKTNCMLQIIDKNDFFKLIKYRPQLIINVSKTLAERVIGLNQKLITAL